MENDNGNGSAGVTNKSTQETPKVEQPTSLAKTMNIANVEDRGLNRVNLFDEKQLVAAENFLTKVMRSEKGGIKSVNDGLAVLMRAQDLNLPFSTCLEHIHVINGKTGVDIHIIKALLLRAACTWEVTKDYQALYEYTDGFNVFNENDLPAYCVRCNSKSDADKKFAELKDKDSDDLMFVYPVKFYKDFSGNIYRDYQLNSGGGKFVIVHNQSEGKAAQQAGKIPVFRIPSVPIDYVTEYKITRVFSDNRVMEAYGHFSRSEAYAAGFFEKDTYAKYARIMIGHRAFTLAARDIASDALFGVMETSELKVVTNLPVDDQDFTEVGDITLN